MTNQTTNKSFFLYKDNLSILKQLTDEEAGKLFKAIYEYQTSNILPQDRLISIIFEPFLNQFKRDGQKYQNVVERNKINGAKGGRPKTQDNPLVYLETQINPSEPKKADKDKDKDKDKDIDNKKDKDISNKPNKEIHVGFESDFQELWQHYTPVVVSNGNFTNKGCKQTALNSYKKARVKFSHQKIMDCLELYLKECQKNNRYTKNVATWLNQSMQDGFKTHEVVLINAEPPKPAFLTKQQQTDLANKEQNDRLSKIYDNR
jgi:hypothetical protein